MNAAKTIIPKNLPAVNGRPRIKDISGLRFGRWLVIAFDPKSKRQPRWLCRCECGSECSVFGLSLVAGKSGSCGCLRREIQTKLMTERRGSGSIKCFKKHGGSLTNEYKIWSGIKARCGNSKSKHYKNYGARGIKMHHSWEDDFAEFLKYIGPRPSLLHSVERINNDGNYEPGNVRRATKKEQLNNTRRCVFVELDGVLKNITQWSEHFKISRKRLAYYAEDRSKHPQKIIEFMTRLQKVQNESTSQDH